MATDSYTLSAAAVSRMQTAVGHALRLGRDATLQEAHNYWVDFKKNFVLDHERQMAIEAVSAATPPDVT
jgi:hypothetical protein